ncbi:MAG: hypothetical protein GWN18_01105, partial [Thermoplasmata archaeon]|nr:hypothetical protein [Thermoplasmata archaeon]NIS10599.1 hypothetical protein [Thermoplasmata archaeon]NIS18562.1 hypothetical protein [Thermoplasmata archaeon]NIT75546.1 hypothetical protein [Thermoplasmata archaeon]NIU47713.1 hypothetical protein [Thermoplasmata archaeon]
TDAEGEFLVHNLPPGVPTLVLAIADGYEDARVETLLEEYALNHVSIVLEELRPVTLNVIGSVLSDDGPVQDARVTVWTEDGYMAVAISDERAEFTFELVAPTDGFVHFRAEHASYSTTTVDLQVPADGGQVPLEIRMEDLVHASVQVQGFVRDPDGFMVDGAQVTVGTMEESLTTETVDGHFSFVVYLPDNPSIQLTATADGYGLNSRSAIIADSGENWVNMTLPLGPDNGNILGSVRTDALRPLEGAEVQLTMAGTFMRTTLSAEDGSFHFRLVPASNQPYQLSVVAPGYDGATVEAMGEPGRTTWYNLVVVEDVTSVETIQGTVSSNEGLPVANAVVRIGGAWNVVTDSNGSYVLVDEDLEGRWSVAASLPGFENTYEIVEVAPGDTITVDLTLGVMGAQVTTVGGSVLKASNGQPLEGATVRLARSASGTWTFETTTGADGTFDFRGVPLAWDGVTVTVSYPGYIDHMARATLSETDATLFEFHMRKVVQPTVEEPVISESEAKQVGAGVTITFGALLVILMTEVGRVALLSLLLVPLYTKIKREKVMDHFVRGRIYEFVCQNPGVNYSAIKEQFKLTNGTVTYHLSMLER